MAALHLDRFFPRSPFRSTANVRVRFGFGHTVYGNHASSAVCGSAGAVGKPYLDGRTRKSPVHSPTWEDWNSPSVIRTRTGQGEMGAYIFGLFCFS